MVGPESIYQLKISLRGTRPPVWRRLAVPADTTLFRLHGILQVAMGWTDTHLHQFHAEGLRFGVVDREMDRGMMSDRGVALLQVASRVGSRIVYEYDFGDGWTHDIVVEKILDDDDATAPRCLAGRMACPPEDCGGASGYADLVNAVADAGHSRHEELMEWLGGRPFDPAAFDCDAVNTVLARRRPRQRAARRGVSRGHLERSRDSN